MQVQALGCHRGRALGGHPGTRCVEEHGAIEAAKWLKEHGGRIVYRINTVLGLAEATAAGMGFGLLPCFIGSKTPGLRRITPPINDVIDGLWLLTHADLRATARVRAFMDFAGAEIAKRRKLLEGT